MTGVAHLERPARRPDDSATSRSDAEGGEFWRHDALDVLGYDMSHKSPSDRFWSPLRTMATDALQGLSADSKRR